MKSWAITVILLSLCGKLMKHFLPRGERSPLFSPLRLLLSLCLIIALAFPLLRWKDRPLAIEIPPEYQTASEFDGDALILEKMGKTIKRSVDTAFPECEYSLEIYADEQGLPKAIRVIGGGEQAAEISNFIFQNYGLKTATAKGE